MVVNQLLKYGEFGIVLFDNFQVTERTRNQFVLTHTRVRIPPSAPKREALPRGVLLFLVQRKRILTLAANAAGFAYPTKPRGAGSSKASADIFTAGEYPSEKHSLVGCFSFWHSRSVTNTARSASEGSHTPSEDQPAHLLGVG